MQKRFAPTKTDADAARFVLASAGIKARVRLFNASVRVCLTGEPTAELRARAAEVLADADLRGPTGGALAWNQPHEAFCYVVR